jgi:hypothetical protein
MLTIAEKLAFTNAKAVRVCSKAGLLSNPESTNWGFCINLQENCFGKGKS